MEFGGRAAVLAGEPDLLNFKKGWMSLLDEQREWKKRWFVLTDSSLRYYRDSNAEEADDLDGEIDLRSCLDVTEFAVQRNYGFQIHTKEAVFTLSAMTSGIRRNWIEALRKNVRPTGGPDVTKLSDSNKENSFRSYSSQKVLVRSEEPRLPPGSEVITRNANKKLDSPSQRQTPFSYVELAPLQQGPLSQENSQRSRTALRAPDSSSKLEELEREQGIRSEERRKWFEGPVTGGTKQDEAWGDLLRKVGDCSLMNSSLSGEQRQKLNEEIEKKWLELERLPLRESKQIPLTALLGQGRGSIRNASGESRELFEKEIQVLKAQLESTQKELESYRSYNGRLHEQTKLHKEVHVPRGYIAQEACERSLVEMESSHQQAMMELQRHHQRELERLKQEKEELLAEETAATAAAIEAMRKAHQEELQRELARARNFSYGGSTNSSQEALRRQHQSDVEALKRDLQGLSERYSQKCLEINALTQTAEERDRMLLKCQQEGRELLRQNQELNSRLSDEIEKLRSFMAKHHAGGDVSQNSDRSSYELEVLLRVKENELQYLKQEVGCLREELQTMQNDKQYASNKYKDIYVELNNIKTRSEREIEQLKEHLRLAMAALQEEATVQNSIA
ncbi:TRIO and F-actin-binding protein isoform X1 [Microcaecilia unicolor]|uniref:TRIO and F-actin-binding protein isoform X1 n=2 Tax=Microcaecilia unicolor TaxID=1415580 RepID=A0A6P7YLF0_9AMPH|nr:TRIO and F-actin-binding protein isoform X1 [Microcaecilia unicolor]